MKQTVSKATIANWQRLGSTDKQLLHRANKTDSRRRIFPDKYVQNPANKQRIVELAKMVVDQNLDPDEFILQLAASAVANSTTISLHNKERFLTEVGITRDDLLAFELDLAEPDFFGALYQTLKAEGSRNKSGLYYTPYYVADELLDQIKPEPGQDFLDPAAGTGIFLLELNRRFGVALKHLHGKELDQTAVLLARANLMLHSPADDQTYPDIQLVDYLQSPATTSYTTIVGNPPWGAKKKSAVPDSIFTKADSFAYFVEKGLRELANGGKLGFVLPISFLNIAAHQTLRALLLKTGTLKQVTYLPNLFQGVVSDVVLLVVTKEEATEQTLISFQKGSRVLQTPQNIYAQMPHLNLLPLAELDRAILTQVWQQKDSDLSASQWGLGIVTGNNKKHVLDQQHAGAEPLVTGKDIQPYSLKQPQHFLKFERKHFQQVARDALYRAPEKLVYKFINQRLVFAYDDQQLLTLNSANLLVPAVPTHSAKTVLAFLNSQLFQYLYQLLFASAKILRGNLELLPFVNLNPSEKNHLEALIDQQLAGKQSSALIDDFIFAKFGLTPVQVTRIGEVLDKGVFG